MEMSVEVKLRECKFVLQLIAHSHQKLGLNSGVNT